MGYHSSWIGSFSSAGWHIMTRTSLPDTC